MFEGGGEGVVSNRTVRKDSLKRPQELSVIMTVLMRNNPPSDRAIGRSERRQ